MKVVKAFILSVVLLAFSTGMSAQNHGVYGEAVESPSQIQAATDEAAPQTEAIQISEQKIYDKINLANKVMVNDPVKSMEYISAALEMAYQSKNDRAQAYCYNTLAALSYQLKRYDISVEHYLKAIGLFKSVSEEKGLFIAYKYIAAGYDGLEKYDLSLKYYFLYADLAKSRKDSTSLVESWNNVARIYYNKEDLESSAMWYTKVLQYHKRNNNEAGIVDANNDLGLVELRQNKINTAMERFNESSEVAQRTGNRRGEANSYSNMSQAYGQKKDKKKQIEYEQQAINTNETYNNPDLLIDNNWNMAQNYIADNNAPEAIPYLHNTINLSKELGELEGSEDAYIALGDMYAQQGEFGKALDTYKEYLQLVDSLKRVELDENLIAIRLSTDLTKSEERIQLLESQRNYSLQEMELMRSNQAVIEADRQQQKVVIWSLAGGMGILAFAGFVVVRSSRQKRRANQLLALQSLRSQMNPHFIFNALNSVNSFISINDERSANKYLSDFSRLMRSVMENSKHDFVSLRSELEILKLYTRLEHFRFSDKFDYTFEVDEEIMEDMVEIPPMLIQPYIENAVWHGLRYKETKGHLWIKFKQEKDHLLVTIEDDGIGRERSAEIKTRNQKETKSTGMSNIRERLNIINELHGTNLKVEVTEYAPEAADIGTSVNIRIPFHEAES